MAHRASGTKIRVRFMEIQRPKMLKLVYQFYQRVPGQRVQSAEKENHIMFDLGDGSQFIKTATQIFYFQCSDAWTPRVQHEGDPASDIPISNIFRNAYIAGFIEAAINTLKKEIILCGRGGQRVTLRPKDRLNPIPSNPNVPGLCGLNSNSLKPKQPGTGLGMGLGSSSGLTLSDRALLSRQRPNYLKPTPRTPRTQRIQRLPAIQSLDSKPWKVTKSPSRSPPSGTSGTSRTGIRSKSKTPEPFPMNGVSNGRDHRRVQRKSNPNLRVHSNPMQYQQRQQRPDSNPQRGSRSRLLSYRTRTDTKRVQRYPSPYRHNVTSNRMNVVQNTSVTQHLMIPPGSMGMDSFRRSRSPERRVSNSTLYALV